jgi:hypothetical protein
MELLYGDIVSVYAVKEGSYTCCRLKTDRLLLGKFCGPKSTNPVLICA